MHSSFYESGGQEYLPLLAAVSLQKLGHEVDCFAAVINKDTCHPNIIKKANVKYYAFELPVPIFRSSSNHFLSYFLTPLYKGKFRQYDALLCFQQPAGWIAKKIKDVFNVPYVYYAQGILRELYPRLLDIQTKQYMRIERPIAISLTNRFRLIQKVDNQSVRNADAVLANSAKTKAELQEIYGIRNIEICYPGVDENVFKPLEPEQTEYVSTKFEVSRPFVFTSNRHEPHKKLEWLLTAMLYVLKNNPEVSLVAAGGFNRFYTPSLLRLCQKLGLTHKVKFVGRINQKDLASFYNASEVYAFSSPAEDFGLGPVEAMACGKPVVAWDSAGPAETVINGVTGLLAKPFDLKDFAQKMTQLIAFDRLRTEMGKAAVSHARKNFNQTSFVHKLETTLYHCV